MGIVKMWNGKSKSEQLVGGKALAVMGTVKLPALHGLLGGAHNTRLLTDKVRLKIWAL